MGHLKSETDLLVCKSFWVNEGVVSSKQAYCCVLTVHHSLAKEHPWTEYLTSLSMRGVGTLQVFPHLARKDHPCPVYSDSATRCP